MGLIKDVIGLSYNFQSFFYPRRPLQNAFLAAKFAAYYAKELNKFGY